MIGTASNQYGPLFGQPEIGSGFAGIEQLAWSTFYQLNKGSRFSGNSAHALHAVENESLRCENGAGRSGNSKSNISRLDNSSVLQTDFCRQRSINMMKYFECQINTCQHTRIFYQQPGAAHCLFGNR